MTHADSSSSRQGATVPVSVRVQRAEAAAVPVMRVVMGGVASRWNVPLDRLDDMQLAVETLVAEEPREGVDLLLSLSITGSQLSIRLDGLTNTGVKKALVHDNANGRYEGCLLDVRLVLESLVDSYQVVDTGAQVFAVEMAKRAR